MKNKYRISYNVGSLKILECLNEPNHRIVMYDDIPKKYNEWGLETDITPIEKQDVKEFLEKESKQYGS